MTETAPYEEIGRIESAELRRYPALLLASVSGLTNNEAFWILFQYISGRNRVKQKIAMTAPVISSEMIDVTIPVITSEREEIVPQGYESRVMSFVLPSHYTREEIPEPLDRRIQIHEIHPRKVAIIRFKGYARDKTVQEEMNRLLSIVKKNDIQTSGKPFLMLYNSPMVPGILRRNEVGIEIKQ
jgi:hypothetical protein